MQEGQQETCSDAEKAAPFASVATGQVPISTRWHSKGIINAARILLLLLCVSGFFFSVVPWGRAIARTAFILPALLTSTEPAALVISGEDIEHTQKTIPSRSGTAYLDIYVPTTATPLISGVRGGVLVIPGAGDNRQVPQLINLLQTLAHSGLVVINLTAPTLINYDISEQDSDAAVQAFLTLTHLQGMEGKHAGIIAFSAGVPIASFAGADPRIRDQVAYITNFGGYFNTRDLLHAFGTRSQVIDGKAERWIPGDVATQVVANMITSSFTSEEQTAIKQATAPGGPKLTESGQSQLSPAARAAYQLLTGEAPEKVEANISVLPIEVQKELDLLSPSQVITQIRAPIFLLHDRNDASIPVTESRDFATALQHLHHPYNYVELHIFDHVEVKSNPNFTQSLGDGIQLFSILTQMLYTES